LVEAFEAAVGATNGTAVAAIDAVAVGRPEAVLEGELPFAGLAALPGELLGAPPAGPPTLGTGVGAAAQPPINATTANPNASKRTGRVTSPIEISPIAAAQARRSILRSRTRPVRQTADRETAESSGVVP
jgi:hypothetical protein